MSALIGLFDDFPVGTEVTVRGVDDHGLVVAHYEMTACAPNNEDADTRLLGIEWGAARRLAFWGAAGAYSANFPLVKVVTP